MKFLLCRAIRRASFTHSSKLEKVEGLKKMTAIYVALVVYMVVLFGVGLFYSKKNATINDFLLAGRDLGVVAATLTVTASLFGGGRARHRFSRDPVQEDCGLISDLHQRLILSKGVITYVDPSGCEKHPYRHSG